MSVQEVAHGDDMAAVGVDGRVAEHLLGVGLGADAHILLAEMLDMAVDAGAGELLREGDLLQGQLVDGCAHRAKQRRRGEDGSLHDCDGGKEEEGSEGGSLSKRWGWMQIWGVGETDRWELNRSK